VSAMQRRHLALRTSKGGPENDLILNSAWLSPNPS
jgi:hypothetical protein